ncbi:MAG: right-handed parallel beta-helix repeat-containing protein [Phycisphaerales bacterium]
MARSARRFISAAALFIVISIQPVVMGTTIVSTNVTSDTTWDVAGSPYVLAGGIVVTNNSTLTIAPGVQVLGQADSSLRVDTGSALMANGSDELIIFSSTAGTGANQWQGLIVNGGTADLFGVVFQNAGSINPFGISANITVAGGSLSVSNSTISFGAGAAALDHAVRITSGNAVLNQCFFANNGDGAGDRVVEASGAATLSVIGCTFDSNLGTPIRVTPSSVQNIDANAFVNNSNGVIEVVAGALANGAVFHTQSQGLEYFLIEPLTVQGGALASIDPGVQIRGATPATSIRVTGAGSTLDAPGDAANPIVMTSATDDAGTRWAGLVVDSSAAANLVWTTVRWAGEIDVFGIRSGITTLGSGSVQLTDCTISDIASLAGESGVYVDSGSVADCLRTSFERCGNGGAGDFGFFSQVSGIAILEECSFIDNDGGAARIGPNSPQNITGCSFAGNLLDRIQVGAGSTGVAPYLESMSGLEAWAFEGGIFQVPTGATMTVEPGVQIRGALSAQIRINGVLNAFGSPKAPILMTSLDDAGVDQWGGLVVDSGGEANLSWTTLRRAGNFDVFGLRTGISVLGGSSVSLTDCVVSDIATSGAEAGIYVTSSSVGNCLRTSFERCGNGAAGDHAFHVTDGASGSLDDCAFIDNDCTPIRIASGSVQNITACSFAGNLSDRILVGDGTAAGAPYFESMDGLDSFVLEPGNFFVSGPSTMTVDPGVTIRGMPGAAIRLNGTLNAMGTERDPIVMTSVPDDGLDQWVGLVVDSGGDANLSWTTLRRAGNIDVFGIRSGISLLGGSSLSLTDCTISDIATGNAEAGVYVTSSSVGSATRTVFERCGNGGGSDHAFHVTDGAGGFLDECVFDGNDCTPVRVASGSVQNLTGCSFMGNLLDRIIVGDGTSATDAYFESMDGLDAFVLEPGSVFVQGGSSVTIEPGVRIRGMAGAGIRVSGTMQAEGTQRDPIVLTSVSDDGVDQWSGIVVDSGGVANLAWTTLRRAGNPDVFGIRSGYTVLGGASLTLTDCVVSDIATGASESGVYVTSSSAGSATRTAFERCGNGGGSDHAFHVTDGASGALAECPLTDNECTPVRVASGSIQNITGCSFAGNLLDRIIVGDGAAAPAAYFESMDGLDAFALEPGSFFVQSGSSMTVEPGVRIRGMPGAGIRIDGSMDAIGTESAPIIMTSTSDDGVGQWAGVVIASGGDAAMAWTTVRCAGAPGPFGNRAGIAILSNSTLDASDCAIELIGGGSQETGIEVSSGAASLVRCAIDGIGDSANDRAVQCAASGTAMLESCSLDDAVGYGIVHSGAALSVVCSSIENSANDGILVTDSATEVVVRGSRFGGNATFAINETGAALVRACCNWWGSPSGPTTPANPGGAGAAIAGDVLFGAFSITPEACVPACPAGDVNGDGVVDSDDLGALLSAFGSATPGGVGAGDLNEDGFVNSDDLGLLLGLFGSQCL